MVCNGRRIDAELREFEMHIKQIQNLPIGFTVPKRWSNTTILHVFGRDTVR